MKTDIKKHENGGAKSWIKAHLSDIIPVLGLILVLVFFNAVSGGKVLQRQTSTRCSTRLSAF